MMRVAIGWSGGKDSAWMLHKLRQDPAVDVSTLLTVTDGSGDNIVLTMLHRRMVRAQAGVLGLPLLETPIVGNVRREFFGISEGVLEELKRTGVTHVAFGDISDTETRHAREEFLKGTGLQPLFPLWGRDHRELGRELMNGGIKAVIVALDPARVDLSMLGHEYDGSFLGRLGEGVDHCGEYEEFQTFAYDSPDFSSSLEVMLGERTQREGRWLVDLYLSTP